MSGLPVDSEAQPFYELLSDGLVWPDEAPADRPAQDWWEVRALWHHRAGLILDQPSPDSFPEFWEIGLRLFPDWPGFLPQRRAPSNELKSLIQAGRARECSL